MIDRVSDDGRGIIGLRFEVRATDPHVFILYPLSIPMFLVFLFFVYRVMDSILLFHASSRMVLALAS